MNERSYDIKGKGFDPKKILKSLQNKKALCPSCEKTLKLAGGLYIYEDKNSEEDFKLYYVICRKCEYKKEKQGTEKKEKIKLLIEKRLQENMYPYACEIIDDPNIDKLLNNTKTTKQNIKLRAFEMTTDIWHKNDGEFFKNNPERRFYSRKLFEGELDQTNKDNPELQRSAYEKGISFAIIHEVAPQQRIYEYVSDLTGHPYEEEEFVAALFMVRVNDLLTSDDIYDMYEQIKENKNIISDFNLQELNQKK